MKIYNMGLGQVVFDGSREDYARKIDEIVALSREERTTYYLLAIGDDPLKLLFLDIWDGHICSMSAMIIADNYIGVDNIYPDTTSLCTKNPLKTEYNEYDRKLIVSCGQWDCVVTHSVIVNMGDGK